MSNPKVLLLFIFLQFSCSTVNKSKGTDFHIHVGKPPKQQVDDVTFDAKRSLLAIDSIDLSRALIISRGYQKHKTQEEVIAENNYVLDMQKEFPNKFSGACGISVTHLWAQEEVHRCINKGFKVFKFHFMADSLDLTKRSSLKKVYDLLNIISDTKLSILVHAAYPKSKQTQSLALLELINRYPQITWIIGHFYGRDFKLLSSIKHDNYFVETSVLPLWIKKKSDRETLVNFMRALGLNKFVFGSDWPVIHPAETLKGLKNLGLSKSELNKILYKNPLALDKLFLDD